MFEFMAKNILTQRKEKGLTQEELAGKLGVSAVAVSKWERGISVPELGVICEMADFFEISVDELLGRTNCLLPEEEKYSDGAMKQYDFNLRKDIIDKYTNQKCKVVLLEGFSELDDKTLQLIIRKLNNTTLLYALAGVSGKVCRRFLENLSGRMLYFLDWHMQREEFAMEKIEVAQKAVAQVYSIIKE